jgi:TRAP-type C4-dicarboxylate transport system substrate-binding protein
MTDKLKLRWVLAHVPYDLFLRSAAAFAKKAHEISNGQIEIEIMGLEQYEQRYNNNQPVNKYEVLNLVDQGVIEMSQMYNAQRGAINHDLRALDMPYLFENHEHARRVLDGDIGLDMLQGLSKNSNVRGLAFTYSGGFRMMVANEPLESVNDISGQRVRVGLTPVASDTFRLLGADPVAMGVHAVADALRDNQVDIGENTWARFFRSGVSHYATHVANTRHSLFLTAIIINKNVWNGFTAETQATLQAAALEAAEEERQESLADNDAVMAKCQEVGIKVWDWSDEQCAEMKAITAPVYEKYKDQFSTNLIDKIKQS